MTDSLTFSIDELERDLGQAARLKVLMNVGGQRRNVPRAEHALHSQLSLELGSEIVLWLSGRFGGETVTFPSRRGAEIEHNAALLRAAILDAGLTDHSRSANHIAKEFGVSLRRVYQVRSELRAEAEDAQIPLPLFDTP